MKGSCGTLKPDYKPEPITPHLLAQLRTNKITVIHGHFFYVQVSQYTRLATVRNGRDMELYERVKAKFGELRERLMGISFLFGQKYE